MALLLLALAALVGLVAKTRDKPMRALEVAALAVNAQLVTALLDAVATEAARGGAGCSSACTRARRWRRWPRDSSDF